MLQQMFEKSYLEEHCFCIISHGDLFKEEVDQRTEKINFHDWCRQQKGVLQRIFEACKFKCLLFDNKIKEKRKCIKEESICIKEESIRIKEESIRIKKEQVRQLIKLVTDSWPQNLSIVSVSPELRIKADIQMIVESASSEDAFRDQLRFVIDYTESKGPEERAVNYNVRIFGQEKHINYYRDQFKNHQEFAIELLKAEYLKACSGIENTLEIVNKEMSPRRRVGVKQMAIVLTEGRCQDDSKAANEAAQLKNSGTQLMLIGVNSVDRQKLESLASDPENVFMAENYEELRDMPNEVKERVCTLAPEFDTTANILFMLDSSGSIDPEDYKKELKFAKKVAAAFNIGPGALRFSAMIFSTSPQMLFDFSLNDHNEIAKKIEKATHLRQSTDTAAALKLARNFAFTPKRGIQSGKKIALVITDGCSNDITSTIREARELTLSGVLVLAIGVGQAVNEEELRAIATRPEDVYTVDNFDALQTIRDEIANKTCILETAMTAQGGMGISRNAGRDQDIRQMKTNPDNSTSDETSTLGSRRASDEDPRRNSNNTVNNVNKRDIAPAVPCHTFL